MGAFEYTALDNGGKERKGVLEGDTPRHIRQLLREKQLLPVTVNEVAQKEAKRQRSFSLGRGVSTGELSLFTRQLATLVRAGLPLEESLLAVSQQTEKPRIQSIILGVRASVMEGHPLADGLAKFPRVFPEIYRSTVAAGEQSGKLDGILERLADYTEGREQIRQKILAAMLYPIVLSIMCFAIVCGLMVYVVPKVVAVFESAKGKLPLITQILIATSDFVRNYGIYMLIAAMLEALRISGEVVTNLPMRDAVAEAAARVREGAAIGRSLGVSKLFPPMTIHLISSGESSGELESMLERAAISQERELDGLLAGMVGLLGPMLIVAMGGFVMAIVFAMLLPIFEMNQLIK
jgi:general secretion pathway protein F